MRSIALALALCAAPAFAADPAPAGVVAPQATATDSLGAAGLPATLRENSYFYQSFGTTDPFRSLLAGDFEPKLQELVDLHTVQMVGVVWENDEIAAMLQDAQGFGYTLRPGDEVKNGSVVSITQDALTARLNIFGQTTQYTLRLQDGE
jgi:Tfp pilus assembly protein PilP